MLKKQSNAILLIAFTIGCSLLLFFLPPISQDPLYHHFADHRTLFGIPNFYNVVSNLPFVVLGITGLYLFVANAKTASGMTISYVILFLGVIAIGAGSAYYHINPSNATLVWDRIPMSITFMSYFSIIVARYVNINLGKALLYPLLLIGIASVLSWYISELRGQGDLRFYAFVQFYPMVIIPLIIFIYPVSRLVRIQIIGIIFLYGVAKFFEVQDEAVFNTGKMISGHSLKHIFAACAILIIVRMVFESNSSEHKAEGI